jgi:hypothetical protein
VALVDALKTNTFLTTIDLFWNQIGDKGASALADALKVNTSMTKIDIAGNEFGIDGTLALLKALEVNTSVMEIDLESDIFDARKMLFSLMTGCADEVSVVLPYALSAVDANVIISAADVEPLRAEFAAVVEERRCRAIAALQ